MLDVLVDTGSASTLLDADLAADLGIVAAGGDRLLFMEGVGGREAVYVCRVDRVDVGDGRVNDFELQIGEMGYGPDVKAILGLDSLLTTGAVIDLGGLEIHFR